MPERRIFGFLMFILFLLTTRASFNKDLVLCGDCSKQKNACKIKGDSGHIVVRKGIFERIPFRSNDVFLTKNFDVCIPSGMQINATDGDFKYICVWSPQLGCQILIPKDDEDKASCAFCRIGELNGIKACPCIFNLEKKKKKSGSRKLHSSNLHIMVSALIVVTQSKWKAFSAHFM
ncbi:uncharacterized protein LOC122819030 [Drosophila biarmipes]|uniref:uncharacterized protein LOC122819030 n=1 Tax=Drosophila biarmipes TaxID=125945 RepID=UPI001CDA8F5E|nr:uncharacterized protein LOC122819030 [Drosophila biarmipes]